MSLMKQLTNILNSEEEPIRKRLKIANNAFNSSELYFQSRKIYLFDWITNIANDNIDAWTLFNQWLNSEHVKALNKTDITQDCIQKIINVISGKLNLSVNNEDIKTMTINSSLALINNSTFHEYFKINLKDYFIFLVKVIEIVDKDTLLKLLRNENIFNKIYFRSDKIFKYFFDLLLPALSQSDCKFHDNYIHQEICSAVQKYILRKHFKCFDCYLQQFFEKEATPNYSVIKYFIKTLTFNYNFTTETSINIFKILVNSVYKEFSNNFLFIYKFTIILFQMFGFDLSQKFNLHNTVNIKGDLYLNNTLNVVVVVFEALSIHKNELNTKVNEISFSAFIQTIVLTIIHLTEIPNENSLRIICYCTDIDPLIIDSVINNVLEYILLRKNNCNMQYLHLLKIIFTVFAKLHRVQNLISKILPLLRTFLEGKNTFIENVIPFNGIIQQQNISYEYDINKMFPQEVLHFFGKCVTNLASWQVMNLFKTFIYHLTSSIDDNLQNIAEDERKLLYIESIGIFLCHFLSSVRIAEHSVSDLVVNKFIKGMEELKTTLGKFGNSLISMEHNHILMRTFLSICYTWGDLYIVLCYYSSTIDISPPENQNKNSLSNISYIHTYLTGAQWYLISERVTNFGKIICKRIMQNLFIQHIKAMFLFENTINDEMVNNFINNFMLSLEDLWDCILEDSFILNTIVTRMHSSQILSLSDVVINNVSKSMNFETLFAKILNSEILSKHLVYNILTKINKLMKSKKTPEITPLCVKILSNFDETQFFKGNETNQKLLQQFLVKFNDSKLATEDYHLSSKINYEKLSQYIKILTSMPVIYLPDDFQISIAVYLLTVLDDLRDCEKCDPGIIDDLDLFLTGILRTMPKHFGICVELDIMTKYIIKNIKSYKKVFGYFIENLLYGENFKEKIENIYIYLIKNVNKQRKYVSCIAILIYTMLKQKKLKLSLECKTHINELTVNIFKELIQLITSNKIQSLQLYALTLKHILSSNEEDFLLMIGHLEQYTKLSLMVNIETADDCEGALLLLSTILYHKSKFDVIVKDDFILNIWNAYKNIQIPYSLREEKRKLIVLIFEHVDNENFMHIVEDLLLYTKTSLSSNELDNFINYIDVWTSILPCNFNPKKSNMWINGLQNLLHDLILTAIENEELIIRKKIIDFEIHLVQTIHIQLTSDVIDVILLTVSTCISQYLEIYDLCVKLLDILLKYRKPLLTDRLPSFLQQYRILLTVLCQRSNSNSHGEDTQSLANSAHSLEMLTKNLISYGKYLARLTPYLIADILQQYETISLLPEIKMHIDNCIYSLMGLCDQHAVSYLMRVLSTPSTEIFKFAYENYNKYYRYKGKV